MRQAHTVYISRNGGQSELLYDYRTPYLEQKVRAKELMAKGYGAGGIVEVWIGASAFGEPSFLRYKVPPAKPAAKQEPSQKKTQKRSPAHEPVMETLP